MAARLADLGPVTVLDAAAPAAGASGAAAGLVNPFAGQRAAPGWRYEEALAALTEMVDRAGTPHLLRQPGLLRPARGARQIRDFRDRAAEYPDELTWWSASAARERWPDVRVDDGALWVARGGVVDLPALVHALLATAEVDSGVHVTGIGENGQEAFVETDTHGRLAASRVVLAPGDGFRAFPPLAALPLGRLKGQTIRARPLERLDVPLLAGHGYAVPEDDGRIVLGSTYEHDFADPAPDEAASRAILEQACRMIPALDGATVEDARAGVRVTVPSSLSPRRLPRIGPIGNGRIWALIGLGSKGLLTAPLLARDLPAWFDDPAGVHPDVGIRIGDGSRT